MTIRDLRPSDASAAASLTPEWDYTGAFANRICLVTDDVSGLVLVSVVPPEADILNLVVAPERRGQGIGRALLQAALTRAAQDGARRIWLEVRESNAAAVHLYETSGFRQTGRRARYYRDPPEDALVLETILTVC